MINSNAFEKELSTRWEKKEQFTAGCTHRNKSHDLVKYMDRRTKKETEFLEIMCMDCGCKSYINTEVYESMHEWRLKLDSLGAQYMERVLKHIKS